MIEIDGREYKVAVNSVGLDTEFMYKYAERTEDFNLNYELGAVYYNQTLTFGVEDSDNEDFKDLFKLLSTKSSIDKGTGHMVKLWTPLGQMSFMMYPNKIQMKMLKQRDTKTWWQDMQVKFIMIKPVESW